MNPLSAQRNVRNKVFVRAFLATLFGVVFSIPGKAAEDKATKVTPYLASAPDAEALIAVGDSLRAQGKKQIAKALEVYRAAIFVEGQGPRVQTAIFRIAQCLADSGSYWDAFRAVESSFPAKFDAKAVASRIAFEVKLAEQFAQLGAKTAVKTDGGLEMTGHQAAARVCEAVLYNDPNDVLAPKTMLMLADCQYALGNMKDAERVLRRCMIANKGEKEAHEAKAFLAKVLLAKKYENDEVPPNVFDEAEKYLQEAQLEGKESPALKVRVAEAQSAVNEGKAKDTLRKALFYLGRSGKSRHRNAGVFLLQEILKKYPDTKSAGEARTRLERLGVRGEEKKGSDKEAN